MKMAFIETSSTKQANRIEDSMRLLARPLPKLPDRVRVAKFDFETKMYKTIS